MSRYDPRIQEEELKNKVATDWFASYDTTRIIGKVDFCVAIPATELGLYEAENALWAEAKAGVRKDIHESFVQLILTIGRARTFDSERPPVFLGAFDAEKIAFLPYEAVQDVFAQNDFNWNVAPSNHETKEFAQLHELAEKTIARKSLLFNFEFDEAELKKFIRLNFKSGRKDVSRIQINKNNFTHIYRKWREAVLPHIEAPWDVLKKKYSLYDRDFYLAELNVDDNGTADISDDRVATDFYITFNANGQNKYRVQRKNADELSVELTFGFKSERGLAAYAAFWSRYRRPPRKDYWNYIVKRLDLLVPQDVRERKGAFFTPQKWVELSQEYLAKELGENWQDEYTVWDCCAGTGNMEAGLTNKYKVWASTLDQQDVDVMKERIRNGANLLESHVFQFDFLNDSFDKLPEGLRQIVSDPERRKKLVVYINPPYAEAGSTNKHAHKVDVAVSHKTYQKYLDKFGIAGRELFTQFFMRIHEEIPDCILGEFSKLKHLQAPNFREFRQVFTASLKRSFIVPADTFDNVKGRFPIGFFIWDLSTKEVFAETTTDVYDDKGNHKGKKLLVSYDDLEGNVGKWVNSYRDDKNSVRIGFMSNGRNDFQNQGLVYFVNDKAQMPTPRGWWITPNNLHPISIFVAVRLCIEATWLNDRDQFLYPNDGWKTDGEFRGDCLVYTLFHGQNRISCEHGPNHWIPFTEEEVGAQDCFASHFMSDFLKGDGAKVRAFLCGEPVARLTGHEFEGLKGVGVIRDAVYESYARVNWQSENPQLGTVSLTKSGINDSLWHGFGRLKLSAFACVPEIIAGGVVVDESRDWKGRGYDSYVIAAPIAIAGEPYCALVVANQRKAGGFRFYLHEVASIAELKKRTEGFRSGSSDCSALSSTPGSMKSLAFSIFAVNGGAENDKHGQTGFVISTEARAVLDAGRELWRYYHAQPGARANAAYYDIRKHFQGVKVDAKGKEKMNATSGDAAYNERLAALKAAMTTLAAKIRPKVFDYGFLK